MKDEQIQELVKFLTLHAYPKIAADINYIERIKETANQIREKAAPYRHTLEQHNECREGDIAGFAKERNCRGILPVFAGLPESQLEKLICNNIEPIAYIIAIDAGRWQQAKEKIAKFKLGRVSLEIFPSQDL
jgi:hypothetical protein